MKKWRLAVFDWNGTLLDDLTVVYGSVAEIFKQYGIQPPSLEQYRNEVTSDFAKFYQNYGIPETATPDELNAIRQNFLLRNWNKAALNEHAVELLDWLEERGIKKAIVSGEIPAMLQKRLSDFKLLKRFDYIAGGAWHKRAPLTELLSRFGIHPRDAFYVDDTAEGIATAKTLGIAAVGYANGYASPNLIEKSQPDFIVRSLKEIKEIFDWQQDG